jgi:hypothetical protein
MKPIGGSAAGPAEPPLDWTWAHNIALAKGDDQVTVLVGTHGQVPIKQDGSFMPRTVKWDDTDPGTVVCSAQSTIFGEVNFMAERDATKVARLIKGIHPIDIQSNNAVVDFTEKLKAAETKEMSAMARDGPSYLDELPQRLDMEQQVVPLLTQARPKEMKEFFRYCAFRHSADGVDNPITGEVSLIDKEFLIDRKGETMDACKTTHEWHINIFYRDIRGNLVTFDIFPMLVQWATPLAKRSEMVNVAHLRVTSMQTIVKALQIARFKKIFIVDLTCFVFRPPLDTSDDWTLEGDHFSLILNNMMTRYQYRVVRDGRSRSSNPGHRKITAAEIANFESEYKRLVEAVRREDSDAVDGPRCSKQRAEIEAAKEEEARKMRSAAARKAARTRKKNAASAAARGSSSDSANSSPKGLKAMRVRKGKKGVGASARVFASASAAARGLSSESANSSPEGPPKDPPKRRPLTGKRRVVATAFPSAAADSSNYSNSDSSMGSSNDLTDLSSSESEMPAGGRRRKRQTLKIQKRRRTNLRRRRRVTKTKQ